MCENPCCSENFVFNTNLFKISIIFYEQDWVKISKVSAKLNICCIMLCRTSPKIAHIHFTQMKYCLRPICIRVILNFISLNMNSSVLQIKEDLCNIASETQERSYLAMLKQFIMKALDQIRKYI